MNAVIDNIVKEIKKYMFFGNEDQFAEQGEVHLKQQISHYVTSGETIKAVLPGFPCKSPNSNNKVFSTLPDAGEYEGLSTLESLCRDIERLYKPGCEITIFSDGTTFADVVLVEDTLVDQYNKQLRLLFNSDYLAWSSLDNYFSEDLNYQSKRDQLIKKYTDLQTDTDEFRESIQDDHEMLERLERLTKLLFNDNPWSDSTSPKTQQGRWELCKKRAVTMLMRGIALDKLIEIEFPNYIRLSVHQYNNAGPKYSISLNRAHKDSKTPWHSVPVLGLYGSFKQVSRSDIALDRQCLILNQDQPWCYFEADDKLLQNCTIEIIKNGRFGVRITPGDTFQEKPKVSDVSKQAIQTLVDVYGFVVFRDWASNDQQELQHFSVKFGQPYVWHFGVIHEVRPDDKPDGFVHSLEKVPLHWDLSMLPLDHEAVKKDINYAANYFTLYCKTPPLQGEGQTTLVDTREALRKAGKHTVSEWSKLTITYNTKKTYFGGIPRTYPLVAPHPRTEELLLKYQEGSTSELQEFTLSNLEISNERLAAVIQEVNETCYSDDCLVEHDWLKNDLVLVDNFRTLHGRNEMSANSNMRELWRVQVI